MGNLDDRWLFFRQIAPYFGRVVSAKFIQRTHEHISGVTRIHNLIEGIYKPADSIYALSIASMLKNPYADRLEFNDNRTWFFHYSPKIGSLENAVNQSMFNAMRDGQPVLVIKQLSNKSHPKGSRYKILGLGIIEDFDQPERLFKIREVTIEALQMQVDPSQILSDDLIETALALEALEAWSPFVEENRAIYRISKRKRNAAFRKIVLANYGSTCAVSRSKFVHKRVIEAQAAHIISKEKNGTDDPRNGLSLSQAAHWAFDRGLFTITDQYEVMVHPKAIKADHSNYWLLGLDKKEILLPSDESNCPHPDALRWHTETIFGKFGRE